MWLGCNKGEEHRGHAHTTVVVSQNSAHLVQVREPPSCPPAPGLCSNKHCKGPCVKPHSTEELVYWRRKVMCRSHAKVHVICYRLNCAKLLIFIHLLSAYTCLLLYSTLAPLSTYTILHIPLLTLFFLLNVRFNRK